MKVAKFSILGLSSIILFFVGITGFLGISESADAEQTKAVNDNLTQQRLSTASSDILPSNSFKKNEVANKDQSAKEIPSQTKPLSSAQSQTQAASNSTVGKRTVSANERVVKTDGAGEKTKSTLEKIDQMLQWPKLRLE